MVGAIQGLTIGSTYQGSAEQLRDSIILDSRADGHVFNDLSRFTEYKPYSLPITALAGNSEMPILGKGTARIKAQAPDGPLTIYVKNAHYSPKFHTNAISTSKWNDWGLIMCEWTHTIRWKKSREELCAYWRLGGMSVIEEGKPKPQPEAMGTKSLGIVAAVRPDTKPTASVAEAEVWHCRLGHAGPEILEQCAKRKLGTILKGLQMHKCKVCAVSKAHRHISRAPQQPRSSALFGHVTVDIFPMQEAYNGHRYAIVMICRLTHLVHLDTIPDCHHDTLLNWLMDKTQYLKRQGALNIIFFQCDGETGFQALPMQRFFRDEGIEIIDTSPYSSYQNGGSERLGKAIMEHTHCLQQDSGIPESLWSETAKAAAYIQNRLPNKQLKWASPLERAHEWLRTNRPETHGTFPTEMHQNLAHLKVYGCRAYPLTNEALQGMQKRRLKLQPHAHIGYLMGYKSSTQYVIWIPELKRCINTPHVSFDESITYRTAQHAPIQAP